MLPASTPGPPELLAPAGGSDALAAAVASGADAVYLGLEQFNARRGADNFTLDSLAEACDFAHLRGVRVYLTANVTILPAEMEAAVGLIADAWSRGVDAVIVQDLGLLRACRAHLPQVRLHASTQLNTHNSETVRFLVSLGVSRVTLARETSLAEIETLSRAAEASGAQVESFAHGALCVCYSGQCLLSSLVGGRSANRGRCAQPCRLPYALVTGGEELADPPGGYLLSPRDLSSIAVLPQLVATGVSALKIEGRMKSPEYVSLVTGVYRTALDRLVADPMRFEVSDGEVSVLEEAFSRGFSEAYLVGESGSNMMSYGRPNNRGVPVGRVVSVQDGHTAVALDRSLDAADMIEVWTGRGRFAQPVGEMGFDGGRHLSAPAGVRVTIALEQPVGKGDRIFRVRNASLIEAAERAYSPESEKLAIQVKVGVRMLVGDPLAITVTDEDGRSGRAVGPIVESARTKSVTVEEVMEHVARLGGTPYRVSSWDVELDPGAGIGYSQLHQIRREAISDYERRLLSPWQRGEVQAHIEPIPVNRSVADRSVRVVVSAANVIVARAVLAAGAHEAHVPFAALSDADAEQGLIPVMPRVCHDGEFEAMISIAKRFSAACAGNLGALAVCAELGIPVQAQWSLNVFNEHAVALLAEHGASTVWLSPELSGSQVAHVARRASCEVGLAIAGRQEVMVTEHCVLTAVGPCSGQCAKCGRRTPLSVLKDRKGYEFPVVTDESGRSHVFNSVPLDLTHVLPDLVAAGVSAIRIDADTLTAAQAVSEVERVISALGAAASGRELQRTSSTTSGHYFRGVD